MAMKQANTTNPKFWAGGAREFHHQNKKNEMRTGFLAFLFRLFPFIKAAEIDQRLFIKRTK